MHGVESLKKILQQILIDKIKDELPKIKSKISEIIEVGIFQSFLFHFFFIIIKLEGVKLKKIELKHDAIKDHSKFLNEMIPSLMKNYEKILNGSLEISHLESGLQPGAQLLVLTHTKFPEDIDKKLHSIKAELTPEVKKN